MSELEALKRELEEFGADNDAAIAERPRRMLNITIVNADPAFTTCLVPVGKGEYLAAKSPAPTVADGA